MMGGERINIAIMVNSIQNDYSTLLCKGAAIAADELDVNLLIVPGRELNAVWDNIEINRFEYQNNVLYSYVTANNIDVLLVSTGTVGFFLSEKQMREFMDQYKDLKVISMETEIEGYPSIVFSLEGLKEAIEHVIVHHGKRKVAFLSGPKDLKVADARLEVYKQVLAENGIEYDKKYVAYGDFTDYCDNVIDELFDRVADDMPEAICCANDTMVISVKRVCEKRGLRLGKDILVTGYDDAVFANVMDPPLTTVKSYIMTMGYQAVVSALKYYETGTMGREYVKTSLITRQSCGCDPEEIHRIETRDIRVDIPKEELIANIEKYVISKSALDIIPKKQIGDMYRFMNTVYDKIVEGDGFEDGEVSALVADLVSAENLDFFTIDSINAMMFALKRVALEGASDHKKNIINSSFERIYRHISLHFAEKAHNIEKRMISDRYVFTRIADDMMDNGKDEDECFNLMVKDLSNIAMKSCYVYIYHNSFFNSGRSNITNDVSSWHRPQHVYLKVFYENGKCVIPPVRDQRMRYDSILNHKFVPYSKRQTMVIQALYFNEEQYGVMLIETEISLMSEVMNISKQICTAIKLTQFMNQLEGALESVRKVNDILSVESVSDQLTGAYNRRGFITESEKALRSCCMSHHDGAILYADLDNLKGINDNFGHKEGDFAIRMAMEFVRKNLRSTDVVGRIGGDEFVALVLDVDERQMDQICMRIKSCACEFNRTSDKPYNIEVSMGVYMFDSYNRETIDQLMSSADKVLYANKKLKKKSPLKDGE
ncbi:MAG: GGDEF domain-containing protein [Ruminococcus sp.]|nr:GGDEF domain-containing protein [Ruminococcus sp.]